MSRTSTGIEATVAEARPPRSLRARTERSFATALVGLASLFLLPGCTPLGEYIHNGFKVGHNYHRPPAETAPEWIDSGDVRIRSDSAADCAWWTLLGDPQLDALVETAYRQNLDLRSAGARIIEARAIRQIAVGNLFPQTQSMDISSLQSQVSRNLPIPLPPNFDLWTAGFNGSWELDVWGRYRRTVESADAKLGASVEGYGEVLVMLLSDVAFNYVQLRTYQQRLAYALSNVEIQRGSLRLAEARLKLGASNELDVRQARSNLSQTEALIPVFEAGAREASNALCALLGMAPTDLASTLQPAPIPRAPTQVAIGYPAELLARRPDIRRAEREVAAQSARVGIATSDLYPALTINGYVGYWGQSADDLFKANSFTGIFRPQFTWNVLNYGRLANNILAQDARLESLVFDYQQTVLRAGKEVENALVRFLQSQRRARYLQSSVDDAERAVELVKLQFEAGTTDFNRVYTVQAFLTAQQDQLAEAQGSIAANLIAVYKALGGGWNCFIKSCGMPAPNSVLATTLVEEQVPPPGETIPPPNATPSPPGNGNLPAPSAPIVPPPAEGNCKSAPAGKKISPPLPNQGPKDQLVKPAAKPVTQPVTQPVQYAAPTTAKTGATRGSPARPTTPPRLQPVPAQKPASMIDPPRMGANSNGNYGDFGHGVTPVGNAPGVGGPPTSLPPGSHVKF